MGNNCQNKRRVIGIDARFYGPVGKGLGRYTQEIVDRIISANSDYCYVIFLSRENYDDFQEGENVRKVLVSARWYSVREQVELPLKIIKYRIDLMHFPHFNVPVFCFVKFVVTIHDLILTRHPTRRSTTLGYVRYVFKNWGYRLVIRNAVKRSEKIISVSEFTKTDILKNFKVDAKKIIVSYEGVADLKTGMFDKRENCKSVEMSNESKDIDRLGVCYNINKPYMLYVGNAYPHKNLEMLLRVFKEVKDVKLVLVGKEDFFYKRIKGYAKELGLFEDRVVFPGYISDSDLRIVYANAILYVFPSLYEGFGLPPLEAMENGCVVVSSNLASMPEILGDACLYFDPRDKKDFLDKINRVIGDSCLRDDLRKRGFQHVKKYSWEKCALVTFDVYKSVVG